MPHPSGYSYAINDIVQLAGQKGKAWQVKWRGKIRFPQGGVTHVYLLDNGYWDCYYEHEQVSAWRGVE